ncbi:hypothetical protein V3H56_14305 [Pseudomonas sp. MS646]|uniref:hypothetical protein n=1 Tax=Pseudomonas sp. MS646 TaxID=3118751 RepID=UPI0030D14FB0
MHLICEVEEIFEVNGVGCVICPGIPHDFPHPVRSSVALVIETPMGDRIETTLQNLMWVRGGKQRLHDPFSIAGDIQKTDIPLGSRVFLLHGSKT